MKYYLSVEFRYNINFVNEDYNEIEERPVSKKYTSELFNDLPSCINAGNKLIRENNWMIQFPGYMGRVLGTYDNLQVFRTKDRKEIIIKWIQIDEFSNLDFNAKFAELKKI